MDKEIIRFHKDEKKDELKNLLKDLKDAQLINMIDQRAIKGRGDPGLLIRAILSGLPCDGNLTVKLRLSVYKHCVKLLQGNEMNTKTASEMVGILMLEMDQFTAACLAELAAIFVDNIKNGVGSGKSLELFPKILSALGMKESVAYEDKEMTGAEYKSHVLNSLCSGRWDSGTVLHLAAMFKDVPLTQEELKFVLTKILRMLKEVDTQELPPLVYQILLLSTKGHKRLVLEGLVRFFVDEDKKLENHLLKQSESAFEVSLISEDQLGFVEGTIILHITFAVKQDQELGREFIKYIKAEQQSATSIALTPFCVALVLSLSRIHRFEEQIFEFLKTAVLKSFKDLEKQSQSVWARDIVARAPDVTHWLLATIRHSVHGWDHVIQGLVQLGFTLMDAFGPKAAFGRITETSGCLVTTPGHRACKLGSTVLLETFKTHEMVRAEILEQILNRVVTKATAPVFHYLELLSETVMSAPQILLDSLPKVREAFDYLSYLPPPTAKALLKAVQPLLKISMNLKDALILVLRKAMFSRQLDARKTAVNGFLMILKHFRVLGGMPCSQASQSFSASQIQVDVHIPYNPASNEGLCLEILGNLRRCLTQQADVRLTLYEGLFDVLCRNTQLVSPIVGILFHHLKKYYEPQEDVNPPLKLEPCIVLQGEEVYTAEPLAHLLACLVQCYLKTKVIDGEPLLVEKDDDEGIPPEVEKVFESLTLRMVKSELEDFELDKSADFSMGTGVGIRNNIFALLVSGVYEVLMEYVFRTGNYKMSSCETVEQLYQNYRRLSDILREKPTGGAAAGGGGGGGNKRGRPVPGKSSSSSQQPHSKHKSLMSVGCARDLIKALYSDENPHHQEALAVLRENLDFQKYVLTVALQKVNQVNASGHCEGPEGHDSQKLFRYCCSMARVLQKFYSADFENQNENKREKQKQVSALSIEILTVIYNIVCTRYKDQLQDFLSTVDFGRESKSGPNDLDLPDLLHKLVKKFQRLVISVLSADDERHSPKEAVWMLTILHTLTQQLGVDGERGAQILAWTLRLCTEQNIDDLSLAKTLLSHLLQLTTQRQSCAPLLRDIARDIHSQLGDIDQEVEVDNQSSKAIINTRTAAPTVLLLLTGHMDRELDDTEWVIARLKGALGAGSDVHGNDPDSPGLTQRETQEKGLCGRLGHMVNTLHELSQSTVPAGTCIESAVKVITRMYGTLTMLVKYYLQMYQQKSGHMSTRFEKLVKLSGTNLTQFVYAMITYIQATQNESMQQAYEKTKKDKKKQENLAQTGKARVMKETKAIPNLIYAIEQYERFLIQLSIKSKVNLMDNFKMSTARDFRINVASLQTALEEQDEQSDSEQEQDADQTREDSGDEETEQENREPPTKRSKVTTDPNTSARSSKDMAVDKGPKKKTLKLGRVLGKKQ